MKIVLESLAQGYQMPSPSEIEFYEVYVRYVIDSLTSDSIEFGSFKHQRIPG